MGVIFVGGGGGGQRVEGVDSEGVFLSEGVFV